MRPMSVAQAMALPNSAGETLKANVTWLNVYQLMVDAR